MSDYIDILSDYSKWGYWDIESNERWYCEILSDGSELWYSVLILRYWVMIVNSDIDMLSDDNQWCYWYNCVSDSMGDIEILSDDSTW